MELLGVGFVVLFALLFLGLPIGFALALVGVAGFVLFVGWLPAMAMIGQVATDTALNYNFSVLPLFVLMGNFISRARLADELYTAANAFLGHRRGGLSMATVVACGGFAAVSGSSVACAATMTRVSVPTMRRFGYDAGFAAGTVAAGGTLGILIPPSIGMVIYSIITDTELGRLLIAGIVPGILTVLLYMAAITLTTAIDPRLGPRAARAAWAERWRALRRVWGMVVLFLIVLGGIYLGVFTPTEAASIGAFGSFLFVLLRRRLDFAGFVAVLIQSARTSAMLFVVLVGALLFANFVTVAGLPSAMERWISGLELAPIAVLLVIMAIYLLLGCLLEPTAMMLLTVPVFFPVAILLGFDPVWFGVFVVIVTEIGMITPPIGLNVFVVKAILQDIAPSAIYRGILPFLGADIVRVAALILFPGLALWLPSFM